MPFEEGKARPEKAGRKEGVPNRNTHAIRDSFQLLIENNLDKLQGDLDAVKPAERLKFIAEFAKFCLPTLKAVEMQGQFEVKERQPISFIKKT